VPIRVAENVLENATTGEKAHLESFKANPGYGGQQVTVKVGADAPQQVAHVTFGRGSTHATIFYVRDGADYSVMGVGQHAGTKGGKTSYSSLWSGKKSKRVTVTIQ
jgi:hypothetical protein